LVFDVNQTVQQGLKNIRKHPATARFRNYAGRELIGRGVDVVHFDARKTLLERGKNISALICAKVP